MVIPYKVYCLIKSPCTFVTSDFPAENPRTQNRTILIHKRHPTLQTE